MPYECRPCREVDGNVDSLIEPEEAEFWGVYYQHSPGSVFWEWVLDLVDRARAQSLTDELNNVERQWRDDL